MSELSHTGPDGKARQVDVSSKPETAREAVSEAVVKLNSTSFSQLVENRSKKGDVLTVAQIAGISAAKKTSELIPLCHQIPLDHVQLNFDLCPDTNEVKIQSTVVCRGRTGVEMEALTAVSVAALTIYDMLKAVQRDIEISTIRLVSKSGGQSKDWHR